MQLLDRLHANLKWEWQRVYFAKKRAHPVLILNYVQIDHTPLDHMRNKGLQLAYP